LDTGFFLKITILLSFSLSYLFNDVKKEVDH
jgi:hypothetical protein